MSSDVQNFYANKTIFITGATGFLGQILLSKLLCSCREIRCIYILIRENKNKRGLHQRLDDMFNDPIFKCVKEIRPDYKTIVKPMKGDCCECKLGMSVVDRAIIENEVEIIFHAAATVKFNAPLRQSALINVQALDNLLEIAKKMKHLKVFMHVSTALSPCAQTKFIDEKFYDPPMKPHDLLSSIEYFDDHVLNKISPSLIDPCPNNYIFTKLIAEDLCREKSFGLPICVFRPAIITSCFKEPLPGWINNLYGPMGVCLGYSIGIIKAIPADEAKRGNIVPGDYTANALILAAYFANSYWQGKSYKESKFDIPIINYSNCTTKFIITWEKYVREFKKGAKKYPFYNMVTLPSIKVCRNLVIYRILDILFHFIPATILDSALTTFGQKPRFKKIYRRIDEFVDLSIYFTTREWTISGRNVKEIWEKLSDKDKEIFYCDLNDLGIERYFDVLVHGVRLYLAKDEDDTLWKAKQKRKIFLIFYYAVAAILILAFFCLLKNCFCFNSIPFSQLF